MILLHQINDDILQLIIDNIALDTLFGNIDLPSLALTCRSLSRLARPVIPKHVSLGIPSPKFQLFKRTLDDDPAYGHGVMSLWRTQPRRDMPSPDQAQFLSFLLGVPIYAPLVPTSGATTR